MSSELLLGTPLTFNGSNKVALTRTLKSAMTERLATYSRDNLEERGKVTPEYVELYRQWGLGRIGVSVFGNLPIERKGLEAKHNVIIDAKNPWSAGSLINGQLTHGGRQVSEEVDPHPVSSSDQQNPPMMGITLGKPRPLEASEIDDLVKAWGYGAKVLYEAGADGAQLHSAHGYLLSLEIKKQVPNPNFLPSIKINSAAFSDGGLTLEESKQVCQWLDEAGLHLIELSGGTYESGVDSAFQHKKESTKKREAYFVEFADTIKPVIKHARLAVTGSFRSKKAMEEALNGSIDIVGLGRPLTAEPHLIRDMLEGKTEAAKENKVPSNLQTVTAIAQIGAIAKGLPIPDLFDEATAQATLAAALGLLAEDKPADVRRLLYLTTDIIETLTAEDDPLPYRTGLDVLGTLHHALSLLSLPSSPPSPSPVSRLPAELIARIVHFCQIDDLRLRQNTNLALSRTCRAFYLAVRPIHAAEVHLFTPHQLKAVAFRVKEDEAFKTAIRFFSTDLVVQDLDWTNERPDWPGHQLHLLLLQLATAAAVDRLYLGLRFRETREARRMLSRVLGVRPDARYELLGTGFPSVVDLRVSLPDDVGAGDVTAVLKGPPAQRRHLCMGSGTRPYAIFNLDLEDWLNQAIENCELRQDLLRQYETVSLPFIEFAPAFLQFLLDSPGSQPILRRLDITLHLGFEPNDLTGHLSDLLELFNVLEVSTPVVQALKQCRYLEHLELGGDCFQATVFMELRNHLPHLHHLVVLPCLNPGFDHGELAHALPRHVRSLAVWDMASSPRPLTAGEARARLVAACQKGGIALQFQEREAEVKWYRGG
ncbi:hypothetical protein JCM8547_006558 [Rhodosporidiobolus lusitaniae]